MDVKYSNSIKLKEVIINRINKNNGFISFDEYMEYALYDKNLGYYTTAQSTIFGKNGDFITAPEMGEIFARTLALKLRRIAEEYKLTELLEIGAGTGKLAHDLIKLGSQYGLQLDNYHIVETSAVLKKRQQAFLSLYNNIYWHNIIPADFSGIIILNEVLDALPVKRFMLSEREIYEIGVGYQAGQLYDKVKAADHVLKQAVMGLGNFEELISLGTKYISEINFKLDDFIYSIARHVNQAKVVMIFIDYGYLEHEYYHIARNHGTLRAFMQHSVHDDVLYAPGAQDLTASVDFSRVKKAAASVNFKCLEYSNLATFLIEAGIAEVYGTLDIKNNFKICQEINTLLLPEEMGEIFKVMIFSNS